MNRATREHTLWFGLVVVAALLRLIRLDVPLDNHEALGALEALAHLDGRPAVLVVPLHGALQASLFGLFGASDVVARLPSALAGVIVVALPWLWRDALGRWGAWCMGVALAISPTLWFASRLADGALPAWTLALATWALARREASSKRAAALSAGLVGALLACGQAAPFPLLGLMMALALDGRLLALLRQPGFGPTVVLAFVVASTLGLWRWQGLGDAFTGYLAWLAGWSAPPQLSAMRLVGGVLLAEPLILTTALAGCRMLRDQRAWLAWIAVGALTVLLYPARSATCAVPLVVGLAACAAYVGEQLVATAVQEQKVVASESLALSGVGFGFAALSGLLFAGSGRAEWLFAVPIAAALALLAVLVGALQEQIGAAWRGVLGAALVWLGAYTVGVGARMAWWEANNPAEPYRSEAVVAPSLAALRDTLDALSEQALGDRRALRVQLPEVAPPALRWQLRERILTEPTTPTTWQRALLLATGNGPPPGAWVGHAFDVHMSQPLGGLGCDPLSSGLLHCWPLARWVALRQADGEVQRVRWTLWVSPELLARAAGRP